MGMLFEGVRHVQRKRAALLLLGSKSLSQFLCWQGLWFRAHGIDLS
jgi:hypothetical protein